KGGEPWIYLLLGFVHVHECLQRMSLHKTIYNCSVFETCLKKGGDISTYKVSK
ncbi:hypothetical protein L9F63_010677, partial [Diploptera punctata]